MPTKPVANELMSVGGKNGGKHWTAAEVEARQAASEGVKRKGKITLKAPVWLSPEALKVWRRMLRQVEGLDLLDNLDENVLAIYCDAVVKYQEASRLVGINPLDEERVKTVQAWARLVAAYADKLGFTPASRARLVKKKADEIIDGFSEFDE